MIRLDGKAFHTYTRGFDRPFDEGLIDAMNRTAQYLCANIQGCVLAYVQSDEITLVLTDFAKPTSDAWFQGNIQKIASISASMATGMFHEVRHSAGDFRKAFFDSRVWFLADPFEVENTLIWRQKDATRNSIQLVAQSLYSHKELHNKNTSQLQEMIFQKGINWNDYPAGKKRGRLVKKVYFEVLPNPLDETKDWQSQATTRSRWDVVDPPVFTKDRNFLREIIPLITTWID